MKEQWELLYRRLDKIKDNFLDVKKRNDMMPIRENLSEIQQFAIWFLQDNHLHDEESVWKEKKEKLLIILEDIVTATEQQDCVGIKINGLLSEKFGNIRKILSGNET